MSQDLAIDPIIGCCGDGTDHVGGVNVFNVGLLEIFLQLPAEMKADIFEDGIAAGVLSRGAAIVQQVLWNTNTNDVD